VRVLLLPVALALAACGRDRAPASSTQSGTPSVGYAGPQALVLRVPRAGGGPRVHRYPATDSIVWSTSEVAPAPAEFLAFDDENGSIAYEDAKGRPVLIELRLGTITIQTTKKLTGLASAGAKSTYGIAPNGDVVRMTPTGEWTWKPPRPARAVYPQNDGGLLVAVGTGANTRLLKLFPPEKRIIDSLPFPVALRTVRTQLGDRLYLAVDSGLVVLRTRTMDWAPAVHFKEPIAVMASTPSGDRVFVLTDTRKQISVVDRFRDRVTAVFELPAAAQDMRVDAFGRYLLARAADSDSIWVLAIGTQKVIGALRSGWRADLPFVGYDGNVAALAGNDVVLYDGETLKLRSRIRDGARDVWYPMLWDGFRPRAAALDEPVRFDSVPVDTTALDSNVVVDSTGGAPPADTTAPAGFVVSFAAYLTEARAKELAGRIKVGGETARVVSTTRDGNTIYRVVLGPFLTREEAERAGRESGQSFWVFEGNP
jgi:hypothetical protein